MLSSMNSSFHLSSNKYSQNDILHSLFGEQYVFRVKSIKGIDKFFTSRHLELREESDHTSIVRKLQER